MAAKTGREGRRGSKRKDRHQTENGNERHGRKAKKNQNQGRQVVWAAGVRSGVQCSARQAGRMVGSARAVVVLVAGEKAAAGQVCSVVKARREEAGMAVEGGGRQGGGGRW